MAGPIVIGIIPARLDSARLPGKALRRASGRPLIDYVIARAQRIPHLDALVVATTDRPLDDPLADHVDSQGIAVHRGETSDVALRLLNCAQEFKGEYVVRLNGDSPFLDPDLIGQGIEYCRDGTPDLVTNLPGRTFPYGISVEVVRVATLRQAHPHMEHPEDREDVTKYFYDHLQDFKAVTMRSQLEGLADARLVVDTEADFRMFETMVKSLGDELERSRYPDIAQLYLRLSQPSMLHSPVGRGPLGRCL
jgi:spore coat polysaccharide biosynthesis protein SpsF (cytidylyltransferase family)